MSSLAAMLGTTADELAAIISDEQEKDLAIPEGKFITEEQRAEMLDNHGKRKYDEGKAKAIKDAFDGKDRDSFLNEFKTSILEEANKKPNEKVQELETTIASLQKKYQDKEAEINGLKSSMESEKRMLQIQSSIPEIPESVGISKQEATALYLTGREFKEDGIYLNGKRLTDDIERSIDLQTDVKNWYESKGWGKKPSGRGGGTGGAQGGTPGVPKTMEEYNALLEAKGIEVGSMEANAILAQAAKANPDF